MQRRWTDLLPISVSCERLPAIIRQKAVRGLDKSSSPGPEVARAVTCSGDVAACLVRISATSGGNGGSGKSNRLYGDPKRCTRLGSDPSPFTRSTGKTFTGVAKNESNYDLQLQGIDGVLRVFSKSQITMEARDRGSLMPKVTATEPEIRDLLAFLSRLTSDTAPAIESAASTNGIFSEEPKPGDWPTYHGRLNGNRHSDLTQIDSSNVAHLAPAWMFPIARAQRLEGTPVVVDGIMYVTTANECYALDAKNGRQIWNYQRPLTKGVIGDAASAINRGVAILGDRVFMVTDDAHIIALSRVSGQLLWDTQMADYRQHYGATGAPLVVGNLVLSGTSGGDEGARGFIDAYNIATGARVWRFWTVPAKGEPGSETWVGRAIEHGCVGAWLTGTFDPASNLIYWPTGNPCPDYNGDERKGDNLYADSVVALEPATGKLRWHYQFTPHDLHDWDAVAPLLAVDANFQGKPRQLLLQANRNGFFYVLDRLTGAFLLGEPFVKKMDWADGIDANGRPKVRASATPTPNGTKTCPAVVGATNWFSSAYNPLSGLFYVMALESCGIYTKSDAWWEQGKSFYGGGTRHVPGETPERFLRALDIQTGNVVWEIPQIGSEAGWGGVLSTAGGLVFFCDDAGESCLGSRRCENREAALAFLHQPAVARLPDDLRGRWQAIHRRSVRIELHRVRAALGAGTPPNSGETRSAPGAADVSCCCLAKNRAE